MLLRRATDVNRVRRHSTAMLSGLVLFAAMVANSCKGTSTVVGPEAAACRFDVVPAAQSVGPFGASGSVSVATTSGCTWTATTDVGWITLMPPTSGGGNGTVNFAVSGNANIGASERTGSVIVAGQRSTIAQGAGGSCPFTIDPGSQAIGAAGGAGAPIGVSSTQSLCRWTATSNAPWITLTAGAGGVGNGVVAFSVEPNTGAARAGTLTIAGRTATLIQTAASAPPPPPPPPSPCPSTISPDMIGAAPTGGTERVGLTTPATCAWTATSNEAWITIVSGASGTGNGVVTLAVRSNYSNTGRRGTITIAGRTVTIIQGRTFPAPSR